MAGRKWACARDAPPPPFRKREESHSTHPDHVENGSKNQNHMHPNEGEDGNTDVRGRGYAGRVHGDLLGTVLGAAGRAGRRQDGGHV